MTAPEDEGSWDAHLRQVAHAALLSAEDRGDLALLRSRMFQAMSQAMLCAYVQAHDRPPSPAEIQHMRRIAREVWETTCSTEAWPDVSELRPQDT
jgi:hypothetical protein